MKFRTTRLLMLTGATFAIAVANPAAARPQAGTHYNLPSQDLGAALRQVGQIAGVDIMLRPRKWPGAAPRPSTEPSRFPRCWTDFMRELVCTRPMHMERESSGGDRGRRESEERRVGKAGVSKCNQRRSRYI